MKKFFKGVRFIFISILTVILILFAILAIKPTKKDAKMESFYIEMPDGTQIGVRQFMPDAAKNGEKVPTILEMTRYGTAFDAKLPFKILVNLLNKDMNESLGSYSNDFLDAGYAYIAVDVRGTGISGGEREIEWSDEEVDDMYHIIDWIVSNEWSNGLVGTYGISYLGNTAELAASVGHEALFAIAPMYSDFNPFKYLGMPGGIINDMLVKSWGDGNEESDTENNSIMRFLQVDGKDGKKQFKEILEARTISNIYDQTKNITYFDEIITGDYTAERLALFQKKDAIEESNVPYYIRVGWQDAATVNGTFERYNTFSNPMEIYIGPWKHAGTQFYDAILGESIKVTESDIEADQANGLINFFNKQLELRLGSNVTQQSESIINYYTLGEGVWKTTNTWPIENEVIETWYLNEDLTLSPDLNKAGSINYNVDFTATTGETNRWLQNVLGTKLNYDNRTTEDEKLVCFTSEPFTEDRVITGNPVVSLNLSSSRDECVVYVYLEDVAPDGTVNYITEGQINAIHRKIDDDNSDYVSLPGDHSFRQDDAMEVVLNEPMNITFNLYATSVQIKEGHSLRIAIAGHDASGFRRIPETGEQKLTFTFDVIDGCTVQLPFEQ